MVEQTQENNQNQDAGTSNKSGKLIVLVIIAIIVVLLIVSLGLAFFLGNQPEPTIEIIEEEVMGTMVPMKEFVVNLLDFGGRRFLKIEMDLEVDKEDVVAEIETKNAILRNYIINILTSKSFNDIHTVEGKNYLRKSIILRCNFILKKGKILNVYFRDFIIQ